MTGIRNATQRDARFAVILATVSVAICPIYPLLNHGPYRIFLRTPLDSMIPIVPIMVIPYLSLIPLIGVEAIVFAIADVRRFQALALAVTLALLVSYLIYALAQSYVIRPYLGGGDWLTAMVRHVYALDAPYNDFPSLHTSLSVVVAVLWRRTRRPTSLVVVIWCGLIVTSTVLIHQHYLADVAGGLVVAWLAITASDRIIGTIHHEPRDKRPVWPVESD